MLKPASSFVSAFAVALVTVSTAAAIIGGVADGDGHPYVGALVVSGSVECSGVLVAPTVFVTAGHCGADGSRVSVSFDSKLTGGWSLLGGTLEVDPADGADLAVVVLDAPAPVSLATLPEPDSAASLLKRQLVTSVGYGYSGWAADGSFLYDGLRHAASSPVTKVAKSTLSLSTITGGPPGRLRRASAVGSHGALRDLRLQGLFRQGRGLSARHAVGAGVPEQLRRASVTSGRAATFKQHGDVADSAARSDDSRAADVPRA